MKFNWYRAGNICLISTRSKFDPDQLCFSLLPLFNNCSTRSLPRLIPMSLPRVDSRSPLQARLSFSDRKPSSSSTSFAPQLLSALHPRKAKYRTTLIGLVFVVFLSTYIFLAHGSSLSPALALRRVDSPVANQLDVALESTENSRVHPDLADSQPPSEPPTRPLRHDSFLSGKGRHRQRPPLKLDSAQELAAISSFIASLPQNVLPPTIDPSKPIDPQLVLDFDTRSPRASEEVRQMVDECWSRNPVFVYSKVCVVISPFHSRRTLSLPFISLMGTNSSIHRRLEN